MPTDVDEGAILQGDVVRFEFYKNAKSLIVLQNVPQKGLDQQAE